MAPINASDAASTSVLERVQDFVGEHKKAILIATAAAVVAGAGVAYYASTSTAPSKPDGEGADGKPKKKKTGSRGARKSSKEKEKKSDGPILEERKPKQDGASVEDVGAYCGVSAAC